MKTTVTLHPYSKLLACLVMVSTLVLSACSTPDSSAPAPIPAPTLTDAQKAVLQEPFTNFVQKLEADTGIRLVPIPAGTFLMGSLPEDIHHDFNNNEKPQTKVTLTNNFFMGATDITQRQYETVMGKNPSFHDRLSKDCPVEMVTWDDAMNFCQKLSKQELPLGVLPEGYIFTLPTEAQWEYACRAGTTKPNSDNLDAIAWYDGNSYHMTHPVGMKRPNAWGLYDMQGNVWQWCLDGYGPFPGGEVTNPIGSMTGNGIVMNGMVIRGGYCDSFAWNCSPTSRADCKPSDKGSAVGFRIVLVRP